MSTRSSSDRSNRVLAKSQSDPGVVRTRTGEKRVIIVQEELLEKGQDLQVISLRHPKTNSSASFVVDDDDKVIRELLTFSEENRCWFIDDTIESKGDLHFTAKIDPLLLILPALIQSEKNVPLDHLLKDPEYPQMMRLAPTDAFGKDMNKIADPKGPTDLNVWKYNESKTLEYLSEKVHRLAKALQDKSVNVQGAATSGTFVKSLKTEVDAVQFLTYAHGILSDYLDDQLAEKLANHLKLPKEEPAKKAKKRDPQPLESDKKKPRKGSSDQEPTEDYSKAYKKMGATKENTNLSANQKALARSASGTKSITSFFTKKS